MQQQILQAAQQLFQKHGYQKVTMDDVAKAIGKGRSSLYYYYKNKDEVFDAVIDREIVEIISEIARMVALAVSVEQKLRAFGITKTKIARKRKVFFDALETGMNSEEISQYAQRKLVAQKKIRKEEAALLNQILDKAAHKKEIQAPDPKRQEIIIFVFMSSLRGLKREMALENNYTRMESSVEMLVQMTMLAIRPS